MKEWSKKKKIVSHDQKYFSRWKKISWNEENPGSSLRDPKLLTYRQPSDFVEMWTNWHQSSSKQTTKKKENRKRVRSNERKGSNNLNLLAVIRSVVVMIRSKTQHFKIMKIFSHTITHTVHDHASMYVDWDQKWWREKMSRNVVISVWTMDRER